MCSGLEGFFVTSAPWGEKFGKFMMPHGIHVDALDRIWTTDVKLNRIVCLNPNSKQIILILGKSFKRKNERSQFCQPSDVLTIHDGKYLFVADGYCNSRIVMFDDSGNYMKEFTVNEQMTDGLKNVIIHGLSFIPDTYSICAVLRLNAKIVCFNIMNDSITFMYQFKRDIQLFAIAYTKIENKSGFYMIGMNNDDGIGYGYSLNLINKAIFAWDDIILNNPHDLIISNDKCFLYISSIGEMKNLQRLKLCKLGDTDTDPILANNSEYYVNILINFTIVFAVLFVLAPITYIFTLCFDKYKSKCQNSKVKSLFKSWRKCLQGKEYKKTDSDKLTLLNN
ncbi:Peptidyl-alpha-hydroxyglycine alpha-amidating lyase 2 [Intoshia linei]|uniref:peptidylamidoglycolate lyase n=1 Tax=Intoshia linei TaxID=1819745 RepID=A0A177B3F6_9BILA|nr:Peptidyl-alpha-hydroxyglycine alpha-amidating lyase 2 [Intoshia linei]